MSIIYKDGDLVADTSITVFCHQCNSFGVMGAGIAKQIALTYPEVKEKDRITFQHYGPDGMFGNTMPVLTSDGRWCINMYSQYHYGRGCMTNYEKFEKCLNTLARWLSDKPSDWTVGFPYLIGCGLAGGDWNIIEPLLTSFSEKVKQKVVIVRKV